MATPREATRGQVSVPDCKPEGELFIGASLVRTQPMNLDRIVQSSRAVMLLTRPTRDNRSQSLFRRKS